MKVFEFKTSQAGFTLVEVLVVIVVMGVLAGISIGAFSGKMKHDRLKAASTQMKSFVDRHAKAIKMGTAEVSIGMIPNGRTIIAFQTADCSGSVIDSIQFDERIYMPLVAAFPNECSSGNLWVTANGYRCLQFDESTTMHPSPVGCFPLTHSGATNLMSGISKEADKNYLRTWFKIDGSFRWN